ncbi:tail fiber domain-containing protein [Shewanella rhizosphaerae]|uniref:tail fiber domain-containing protein n=1 Tax=Shewanella rhizosphaerae TaxID=2864207 RepID=UPI001C657BA2|nr:tail fiber domain-containing protein [Shewanella rhizosphaerae]QYK12261.1 tail fiber domain-containing protein [Shewanella rhizosphaerae]
MNLALAAGGPGTTNLGTNAGSALESGAENNTNIGENAGATTSTGDRNTNVGSNAGSSSNSSDNTFVGYNAGTSTTWGDNTFVGSQSGEANVSGTDNVYMGARAGQLNNATDNVFIGSEAGKSSTIANGSVFIGEEAGEFNTEGDDNVFIGENSGHLNTTGEQNTFIGRDSGAADESYSDTKALTGYNNTAIGDSSGYDLKVMASRNSLFGAGAGNDIGEGLANTMIGADAGVNTEYADFNTFVGVMAGWDNNRTNETDKANRNTALGASAGFANRRGEDNVWVGAFSHSDSKSYTYDAALESDMQIRYNGISQQLYGNKPEGNQEVYRTTVLGAFAGANDNDSISIGYGAITDKTNSISLGASASAKGQSDMAIGNGASSTHTEAMAIGYQATSHRNYAVTIGNANTLSWDAGGDGTTSLGTAKDCAYNDRNDNWSCNEPYRFADVNAKEVSLIGDTDASTSIHLWADEGEDYDDRWDILVGDSGTFSIGSYANSSFKQYYGETLKRSELLAIDNQGNATISGNLTLNSDRRLKTQITPISNALTVIQQINGVTYHWKAGLGRSAIKQYGVIAQNVEAVLPELVKSDDKGIKSVNYQALIPVLINATQEQQKQLDAQRLLIEQQQQQIAQLIQMLSAAQD